MESRIAPLQNLTQQPLAVDFIDNKLKYHHPAFKDLSVRFDPVSQRYLPASRIAMTQNTAGGGRQTGAPAAPAPRPVTGEVESMTFWDSIFPDAMKAFKDKYPVEPEGREKHGYSMRKQNWREVSAPLKRSRDSYEGRTGRLGFLKSGTRRILNALQAPIKQGIRVVPDMDIVSPVLGAVEIFLDAIKNASDIRNNVSDKLDQLEHNFEAIEVFTTLCPGDQNIRNASVTLVATIFKAIEEVIGYFTRNILLKAGVAVLTGEAYQKNLKRCLNNIEADSKSLLEQARYSQMDMISTILQNTTRALKIQESQANMANNFLYLLQEKENLLQEKEKENSQLRYRNGFLEGQVQVLSRSASPSPSVPPEEPFMSQEDLFVLLDVPDILQQDIEHILWNKELISTRDQERAEQLMSQREFRGWVVALESSRLLIHGDFDTSGELRDISALSVFTAMFGQVMDHAGEASGSGRASPTAKFCSVSFFCGLHSRQFHDFVGPEWMIRSLIAQLLDQDIMFDTTGLEDDVNLFNVQLGDLDSLCSLFVWLVRRLPPQVTLFCFVDGIIFFERPDFADAMGYVLRDLLDLVEDEHVQCKIKVLITSPTDTKIVRHYHAFAAGDNTLSTKGLRGSSGLNTRTIGRELDDEFSDAFGNRTEDESSY